VRTSSYEPGSRRPLTPPSFVLPFFPFFPVLKTCPDHSAGKSGRWGRGRGSSPSRSPSPSSPSSVPSPPRRVNALTTKTGTEPTCWKRQTNTSRPSSTSVARHGPSSPFFPLRTVIGVPSRRIPLRSEKKRHRPNESQSCPAQKESRAARHGPAAAFALPALLSSMLPLGRSPLRPSYSKRERDHTEYFRTYVRRMGRSTRRGLLPSPIPFPPFPYRKIFKAVSCLVTVY